MLRRIAVLSAALVVLATGVTLGQYPPGQQGSSNMKVVAHIPMTPLTDIEIEQDLSRPYVYVSHFTTPPKFDIVSLKDPAKASVIYRWQIELPELTQGRTSGGQYFKLRGRYYYVQSVQIRQGGPNADLVALVFDVTGLPNTSTVREVARIRDREHPGGSHEAFLYKHSDGRVLFFTTVSGDHAAIYDMEKVLRGDSTTARTGRVPLPPNPGDLSTGYHDFYVGYHPDTRQDRFYGAGGGGYYVYDVTRPEEPKLMFTMVGIAGMNWGHTFTPTPDGRYVVGEAEWQYQPLRIFDLKPGFDGQVKNISRPIGAWTADWKGMPHNHEVRWPYVFVSGYEDGVHVFNMMDPTNPYTVGYYDTYDGPDGKGSFGGGGGGNFTWNVIQGSFGIDVRNADGLIVTSDMNTGFWALKMDGFDGWNGHQWGMPNVSSVQDWDNGPDGAPKPQRVS